MPASPKNVADEGGDASRQRKFFPRLKTLLSDEYEDFLRQIIDIVETNQCAAFPTATAETPWSDAFETIYKTVASDYALPQGKNRLHKFKEKMVELWGAMQSEVTLGVKSEAHPIYRTALKQWKLHQSVVKERDNEKKAAAAAAVPPTPLEETGMSDGEGDDDHQRPRKKSRQSEARRIANGPDNVEPNNTTQNMVAVPFEMMDSWQRSLSRLENMLTACGLLQQKLPSPLYELHRLKTQMPEADFDSKVLPAYEQEIGRHLAQVTAHCRTTSQPGILPHLIEGIEVLRQSPQSAAMKKSLDYTHKTALTKYLKLISRESSLFASIAKQEPTVHPGTPADTPTIGGEDNEEAKNKAESRIESV